MNNHDCICAVLAAHREARAWDDESVARDLVAQLGLDPVGEAKNARPVVAAGISEEEVVAQEAAAQQAVDKAKAAREALSAQAEEDAKAQVDVAGQQADALKAKNAADAERMAKAQGLGLAPTSTQAQIDAEEARLRLMSPGDEAARRLTEKRAAADAEVAARDKDAAKDKTKT